jgi:hypothetical protein
MRCVSAGDEHTDTGAGAVLSEGSRVGVGVCCAAAAGATATTAGSGFLKKENSFCCPLGGGALALDMIQYYTSTATNATATELSNAMISNAISYS